MQKVKREIKEWIHGFVPQQVSLSAGARFSRRGRVLWLHTLGSHSEVDSAHDHLFQVSIWSTRKCSWQACDGYIRGELVEIDFISLVGQSLWKMYGDNIFKFSIRNSSNQWETVALRSSKKFTNCPDYICENFPRQISFGGGEHRAVERGVRIEDSGISLRHAPLVGHSFARWGGLSDYAQKVVHVINCLWPRGTDSIKRFGRTFIVGEYPFFITQI